MIFSFLQYIQPIDYFNLVNRHGSSVFPNPDLLPKKILSQLTLDNGYKTQAAQKRDLAWQAIQKGYIGNERGLVCDEKLPLEDEYHFIRKYFHKLWALYVLCLRLATLHHPVQEILTFHRSRHIKRVNVSENPISYSNWFVYESKLLSQKPWVSVVIPTLNRYEHLTNALLDLEKQDYDNFDVIVIDQSHPFRSDFYSNFRLKINVIRQAKKGVCQARDTAILSTDSEYLLLFDDDSRVGENWISNHLKCLDFFNASISSGSSLSTIDSRTPESYQHFKVSNQIDTGNAMFIRDVFRQIGLFDHQLESLGLEDAELGLRAYLAGFLPVSNPMSPRLHLKAGSGGFREIGIWDGLRSTKWFAPKPTPSALYISRKYFGAKLAFYSLLPTVPPSLLPFRFKKNPRMLLIGYILLLLLFPIISIQVLISWRIAGKKITEGAKIKSISFAELED